MKKLAAISLLFVFLSANTELHQLLKLPLLIHHYLEHHQEEQDKSFAHFLDDHYSSNPEHSDNEHNEHEKLPFKTNDCATMHTIVAFNNQHNFSFDKPHFISDKVSVTYNVLIYSSAFLNRVWQPPQFS